MADTVHFAHHRGRARPDCEQYFPTEFPYSGTSRGFARHEYNNGLTPSYLAFDIGLDGPELTVWLPPAEGPAWAGSIRLLASVTRTVHHRHLPRGLRLPFPLEDGQWKLEVIGDVSEEYLSRLTLGRQSLELERNIFYACTESGRRVEVSDAIPLGSTLWWLRRSPLDASEPILARISVELHAQTSGWLVYLVSLPDTASRAEIAAFSNWFQRRVRPRRPAVWVASPWPRQILHGETPLFATTDGPLCWQADQNIDLRVLARDTGRVVLNLSSIRQATWETIETGEWDVEVNQVVVGAIRIVPSAPPSAAGLLCALSDGRTFDIVDLQRHANALLAAGATSISGELRWAAPAVGGLLYVNDKQVTSPTSSFRFRLDGRSCIAAGKLGYASLREAPIAEAERQVLVPAKYEPLARWLLSVGTVSQDPARLRLDASLLPAGCSALVQQLARLSWSPSLAAQVRWLGRALGE